MYYFGVYANYEYCDSQTLWDFISSNQYNSLSLKQKVVVMVKHDISYTGNVREPAVRFLSYIKVNDILSLVSNSNMASWCTFLILILLVNFSSSQETERQTKDRRLLLNDPNTLLNEIEELKREVTSLKSQFHRRNEESK